MTSEHPRRFDSMGRRLGRVERSLRVHGDVPAEEHLEARVEEVEDRLTKVEGRVAALDGGKRASAGGTR